MIYRIYVIVFGKISYFVIESYNYCYAIISKCVLQSLKINKFYQFCIRKIVKNFSLKGSMKKIIYSYIHFICNKIFANKLGNVVIKIVFQNLHIDTFSLNVQLIS